MTIDVSVVVPFFNPGANIDECLDSMVSQTLPQDRFEVILVDDGSTDGSDARVATWVARYPALMSLKRIEQSGGPARPRNIGMDLARGRYIQFLDSDDTMAPEALERELRIADESSADVVVGKLASDFRGIWQPLFRATVTGRTLADYPLIQNLTVCKMFRREFLSEHNVRFPEGPHYIEDQQICIQAYAHAKSVAVLSDITCYFYRRRRVGGRNFGDTTIVPAAYYRELAAIFDVIDTEVEPAARESSLARYYRGEMLGRLRGAAMLGYDEEYRQEIFDEIRQLAVARIPESVRNTLPTFSRIQSQLLIADRIDDLLTAAQWMDRFRLTATGEVTGWRDGRLVIDLDAHFRLDDEPLQLESTDEGWALPAAAGPGLAPVERLLGDLGTVDVDLASMSRSNSELWSSTDGLAAAVDDDGVLRVRGEVEIDPSTVMGGRRLSAGLWDLRLRVIFGDVNRSAPLRPVVDDPSQPAVWIADELTSVRPYWTADTATLALDVDSTLHSLQDLLELDQVRLEERCLTIPARHLIGAPSHQNAATVVLTPLGATDVAPVRVPAVVTTGLEGSDLIAELPALADEIANWHLWVRLEELGGTPAVSLPVGLHAEASGRLSLTSVSDRVADDM